MPAVALVLVSHSARLAAGVRELVGQMAPDVTVAVAGGLPDGGIGTDLDAVQQALGEALDAAADAIVLCDLGSAVMTAEIALELLPEPERAHLVDAPLVEGALAAAVAAQGDTPVAEIVAAARRTLEGAGEPQHASEPAAAGVPCGAGVVERTVVLANPLGLHARPAARVAALAASARPGTTVRLGRPGGPLVEAEAVLRLVGLALRGGDEVRVECRGPRAAELLERVGDLVASGFGESGTSGTHDGPTAPGVEQGDPAPSPEGGPAARLAGIGASPGTAVGPVLLLDDPRPDLPAGAGAGPQTEQRRARDARAQVSRALVDIPAEQPGRDVLAMHRALLGDPDLDAAVSSRLQEGLPAEVAWWQGASAVAAEMAESGDQLLAERAADVRDVALRVLAALGVGTAPPPARDVANRVVVAEDLPPSWVPALSQAGAAGLALAGSGATSHAVVLARGLGLPAVAAVGAPLLVSARALPQDRVVVLDGTAGVVDLDPPVRAVTEARRRGEEERAASAARRAQSQAPVTVGGRVVPVMANVASAVESAAARREGADGVGLLRTEMLLADRSELPTEAEQVESLVAIGAEQGERRVVVRSFDVGGDKPVPALDLDPVRHGFLGERGLRLALARRDLLRTQLRAVLRAAARLAPAGTRLALMAPMVTTSEEVRELRAELEAARQALDDAGVEHGGLAGVGVMVEVPAAALGIAELAPLVDFVSVGTNDLIQYVMAAERTNAAVAHLYRPDHPAVWRLLELLVDGAHAHGREVAVCGQMAAEPEYARRLVAIGVDELSVPAGDVARIKAALRAS